MDVLGVRVFIAPASTVAVLVAILAGIALGTISGLLPGLHVNTLALLLAAVAPLVPGPPQLVGAAMLAAGVSHSFLDIVPALALGVPDPAMAVGTLPGHRLVLGGRGREALRISAMGSSVAVATGFILGLPVTWIALRVAPLVYDHLTVLITVLCGFLVIGERSWRARFGGLLALSLSGALGFFSLPLHPGGLISTGDVLSPLFAGLFGVPILLQGYRNSGGLPRQDDATVTSTPRGIAGPGIAGSLAGAAVAYIPGVSGSIAAIVALEATKVNGDRPFIAAISGINTANSVFAIIALFTFGDAHTGVLVAFQRANLPKTLPLLLVSVALAACAGAILVPVLGDRYFKLVRAIDHRKLTLAVCFLLVILAFLFAGWVGIVLLVTATLIGFVPVMFGARRVHLMGVLLVPIAF